MFIISRSLIVKENINRLITGYSAYAESKEVIRLMQREISKLDIPVVCDKTDSGYWFIPKM